jgi:hypothetical protein
VTNVTREAYPVIREKVDLNTLNWIKESSGLGFVSLKIETRTTTNRRARIPHSKEWVDLRESECRGKASMDQQDWAVGLRNHLLALAAQDKT